MVKNAECLNTSNCCVFKCSNVSNATIFLFLMHEDVPKAFLKSFIFSKQQKKTNSLENTLNN